MASSRRSSGRRGRRKKRGSLVKNATSFVRTYFREVTGLAVLFMVIVIALYVYKHWQGP